MGYCAPTDWMQLACLCMNLAACPYSFTYSFIYLQPAWHFTEPLALLNSAHASYSRAYEIMAVDKLLFPVCTHRTQTYMFCVKQKAECLAQSGSWPGTCSGCSALTHHHDRPNSKAADLVKTEQTHAPCLKAVSRDGLQMPV